MTPPNERLLLTGAARRQQKRWPFGAYAFRARFEALLAIVRPLHPTAFVLANGHPAAGGHPMDASERITIDPLILVGKPIVRGTRIAVELVLDLLAGGCSVAEIVENYPTLTQADVLACVAYAAEIVRTERVYPLAS